MADSNAVGGLKWVKDEIVTSLQRVLGWLEEFVEREGGQSQLNDAVTALSEVRGLLSGLQLIGPARLTEEMQTLCEDLQAESLPNRGEVAEALMLALIQLPGYLDKLGADQADIPTELLPSINDLRGSRGAAPLSEAELLVPASVLAESEMLAADVRRSLGRIAAKVRPHFHRYLLQWLRDDNTSRQGLVGLGRLFHRLQRYIGAGIFHELFLVAEAVAEALLEGSIAADTRTKAMIAHLDRVIKSFGADPDARPEANAQSQLFDLLSLIAHSESSSYRVNELRSAYGLEQAGEGGEPVSASVAAGPGPAALGDLSLNEKSPLGEADTRAFRARAIDEARVEVARAEQSITDLAAMPAASRTIGEMPPAGEASDAGAAQLPTSITPVERIDPELRDPDRRAAKVIPWPAPGRARTEEMVPALGSGEAETEAADEEIAEIATLAEADDELLDIFRSEAREHLAVLQTYCVRGQEDLGPAVPDESVIRALHTLTRSARMTGVLSTAGVTAPLERLLQDHRARDAAPNISLLNVLGRGVDALEMRLTHIPGYGDEMETLRDLAVDLEERIARLEPVAAADHIPSTEGPGELSEEVFVAPDLGQEPDSEGESHALSSLIDSGELGAGATVECAAPQIRVRSDHLDRLVNNAGEISIYHARLSQQGGLMSSRLGEFDRTLDRLGNQLRDLETEIEAQIIHRYESDADTLAPGQASFDPPELDRFSPLQQLSRSLAETVNDLGSLRTLLQDLQGESDTLLQQQAQLAEDLRDGLLRTRMVQFVQVVPRLRRVVRQMARQLRKEARLKVSGPEVELDRSIQQRMLAPLEHLLRNAVAHGIELPEQRKREGKPARGVVSLMLNREGDDLVITVADDGAGLDFDAIRRHAVDSGLIAESAEAGEEELTGLILEAGFSTVDEVSQLAGRGEGLDVVNAEVQQLSGALGLETQPGRGTSFTIRLPLTLMDNA